jgi:predicted cupin superfamily sugar epimerase
MDLQIEEIIAALGLRPLPGEGGLFAETYRSIGTIPAGFLPEPFAPVVHVFGTAIYFLLSPAPDSFSALHRLCADEVYHFYLGDPIEMLLLEPDGGSRSVILGQDLRAGQRLQFVVPGGVWQGSRLIPGGRYALLGTSMAPGYEPLEFELGEREVLSRLYPRAGESIARLTRS